MTAAPTPSSPAERLLDTAAKLFPIQGIRAVGIDQLLATAGVAKGSLYQAFGSKDALVVAYLERRDAADRAAYRAATTGVLDPTERVLVSFSLAATSAKKRAYRGCLFLNAATEFPDRDHPVAGAVEAHRAWIREQWRQALEGHVEDVDEAVWRVQLLYDGGIAGMKAEHSAAPIERASGLVEVLLTM